MKKIIFVLFFSLGIIGISSASTRITIGTLSPITINKDLELPSSGNFVYDPYPDSQTTSWSFPVHWEVNGKSGDFTVSGDDSVSTQDILAWLIDLFW